MSGLKGPSKVKSKKYQMLGRIDIFSIYLSIINLQVKW